MAPTICKRVSFLILSYTLASTISLAQSEAELERQVITIFQTNCAKVGCHLGPYPQQNMDLTPENFYASLVDEPSLENPNLKRVDPGSPETSYLVKKVRGAPDIIGAPMPLVGERLTDSEIAVIESWISSIEEVDQERKQQKPTNVVQPYSGWQAINLPSTRMLKKGTGLFRINHRFNPSLSDGFNALYGLDGSAIIFLGLGYAFTDDFFVALGRTNASDNFEFNARYRLIQQSVDDLVPLSLSLQTNVNWISEKPFRDEFKFSAQVTVSRQIVDKVSVAFVPGILFNADETVSGEDPMITLGMAAKWNFRKRLSWLFEWAPIVSGYTLTNTFGNFNRFDSWGTGLEIATGGHTFQIVLSNSVGLSSDQYMRGGDLDPTEFFDGKIRLGFNIYRVLNF